MPVVAEIFPWLFINAASHHQETRWIIPFSPKRLYSRIVWENLGRFSSYPIVTSYSFRLSLNRISRITFRFKDYVDTKKYYKIYTKNQNHVWTKNRPENDNIGLIVSRTSLEFVRNQSDSRNCPFSNEKRNQVTLIHLSISESFCWYSTAEIM